MRRKQHDILSILLTCFIFLILVLAGPAQAFQLELELPADVTTEGVEEAASLVFNVSMRLEATDFINITEFYVNISNNESHHACRFSLNGSLISCNSSYAQIQPLSPAWANYSFGSYYGYGYEPSGAYIGISGSGYGYGYQQQSEDVFRYQVNWTAPSYRISGNNTYSVDFGAIVNGHRFQSQQSSSFNVIRIDPPPQAYAVAANTTEDTPVQIQLNCTDEGALTYNISTQPSHGSVQTYGAYAYYEPSADYAGIDSFNYSCTDQSSTRQAEVQVNITPVNDAPQVTSFHRTVRYEGTINHTLIGVSDVDDAQLNYSIDDPRLNVTGQRIINVSSVTGNFTATLNISDGLLWTVQQIAYIEEDIAPPELLSYYPQREPSLYEGSDQVFNVSYAGSANVTWYLQSGALQNRTQVGSDDNYTFYSSRTNENRSAGIYLITARINNSASFQEISWQLTVNKAYDSDGDGLYDHTDTTPLGAGDTTDIDGDGIPDLADPLLGNGTHVQTAFNLTNITYQNISDGRRFALQDTTRNVTVLTVDLPRGKDRLRAYQVYHQEGTVRGGRYMIAGGFNETDYGVINKTLRLLRQNTSYNSVCVYDAPIFVTSQFTDDCSGMYETKVACTGVSTTNTIRGNAVSYRCSLEPDGYYQISGLSFSGVRQISYTAPSSGGGSTGPLDDAGGSGSSSSTFWQTGFCGDTICATGESWSSCPEDCPKPPNTGADTPPAVTDSDLPVSGNIVRDTDSGRGSGGVSPARAGSSSQSPLSINWIFISVVGILIVSGVVGGTIYMRKRQEKLMPSTPEPVSTHNAAEAAVQEQHKREVQKNAKIRRHELETYIHTALQAGQTREQIRQRLLENKWPSYLVDYIFVAARYPENAMKQLHQYVHEKLHQGWQEDRIFDELRSLGWRADVITLVLVYERGFREYDIEMLEKFVRDQVHAGISEQDIRAKLERSRWSQAYVDTVLEQMH